MIDNLVKDSTIKLCSTINPLWAYLFVNNALYTCKCCINKINNNTLATVDISHCRHQSL